MENHFSLIFRRVGWTEAQIMKERTLIYLSLFLEAC
jgi:hypothetical protein